jgi:hypothetical protein
MDIDLSLILSKALLHVAQVQPKLVHGLQDVILTLLENRVDSSDTRTFVSATTPTSPPIMIFKEKILTISYSLI